MWSLTESLVELLQENDSNMVRMAIILLRYLFVCSAAPIHSPIALRLAKVLLPLFDSVRLCAPGHRTGCSPDTLWPRDFNTGARVGLKEPMLGSFFLPFIQDDSQVQLGSMILFQEVMDLLKEEDRNALKPHVRQSLFPLSFHCHDENPEVAEVRTCGLLVSPRQGARLPPALVPGGLQPPPGLGTGTRVLCPGLWGHLCTSAALQASMETLLHAAGFLKKRGLKQVVKKEKLSKFGKRLVRMAWKCQAQPGAAP